MSIRSCERCEAKNKNGNRCSRTTCKTGPYCWQHTIQLLHVKVEKSNLPNAGLGLFATKDFKANENVANYTGQVIRKSHKELDKLEEKGEEFPYVLTIKDDYHIDAKKTNSGVGRYVNDCFIDGKRKSSKCNTRFVIDKRNKTAKIRTTKRVKKGQEFLVSYGNEYWKNK